MNDYVGHQVDDQNEQKLDWTSTEGGNAGLVMWLIHYGKWFIVARSIFGVKAPS